MKLEAFLTTLKHVGLAYFLIASNGSFFPVILAVTSTVTLSLDIFSPVHFPALKTWVFFRKTFEKQVSFINIKNIFCFVFFQK